MIRITNDTLTLNGALSELGETLASNITAKGVSASASDGLTTLAGKILQISGGGGSTTIFEDNATSDNSSTLFGSYISLRNSGTGSVTYTTGSPNYYLIANTRANAEAFIPYSLLNGLTDSFKITVKSAINSTSYNACLIGLYYYEDDNNWGGVKGSIHEQWISDKTNGTFSETQYTTGKSYSTETLTTELVYNSNDNTLSITSYDSNDALIQSETMNIPITLSSNVKWGTSTTWSSSDKHRVYEIKAETLGGGSDCSQYQTQINNAIEYINGSGN